MTKGYLRRLMEAIIDGHFIERLSQRILDKTIFPVGFERDIRGTYELIGLWKMPVDVRSRVVDVFNKIHKFNFPSGKSYAIKVCDLNINPRDIQVKSGIDITKIQPKRLLVIDEETKSNGNVIYAIIRNNKAMTLYYSKNYVNLSAAKMNVDVISNDIDELINNLRYPPGIRQSHRIH